MPRLIDRSSNETYCWYISDDCNRVVLQSCQDGDYINASYVSLPLPGVNNTLKYIAAQGIIDCIHFNIKKN